MSPVTVTISPGGSSRAGGMAGGVSPGMADWLRVRRIARRIVADCSFGSGSSFEWISITKAELTAENKPACDRSEISGESEPRRMTYENQGGVEVLVILPDIVCIVLCCLPLVHRIEVESGVIALDRLKERSEGILEARSVQRPATEPMQDLRRTTLGQFAAAGSPLCP